MMAESSAERLPALRLLRGASEAVLLALVVLTPWAFGTTEPVFECALACGVALLLLLTAVQLIFFRSQSLPARPGPVLLVLAGLLLFTAFQAVPLPRAVRAVLSPNAERLDHALLPDVPERLPGESAPIEAPTGDRPLSLHPSGTRTLLVQLLTVFVVFGVVRTQIASPQSFRRLAWVCLINGALLALEAIAQMVSSNYHVVYWTFQTQGAVFGPFICRNHFPYYQALCLGLGASLLGSAERGARSAERKSSSRSALSVADVFAVLQDPRRTWLLAVLGLLLASILLSLSRGGVLALAGAAAAMLLVRGGERKRGEEAKVAWPLVGVGMVLAVGLVAWVGWSKVEQRLATLGDPEVLRARGNVWSAAMPLVPRFLAVGTGGGTFRWAQPLHSTTPGGTGYRYYAENAHNEYLEALVEGGVPRLALTLLLAYLVLRAGWVASRQRGRGTRALARGATFGLTAVVLHSFVDFGLHVPAVTLLATVVAAQLLTAAAPADERRVGGWPAYLTAALLLPVAAVLVWDGWSADRAERYRLAGEHEARGSALQTEYFAASLSWKPGDPELELALAEADLKAGATADGLRHLVRARNRGPLLPRSHVLLAAERPHFAAADPASRYLERATRLLPTEPEVWLALGGQRLAEGNAEFGAAALRRVLELSDRFLPRVLEAGAALGPDGLRERVLVGRPAELVLAADRLFPAPEQAAERRPFYADAARLYDARPPSSAAQQRLRGRAEAGVGRLDEALISYRAALRAEPKRLDWAIECVNLLRQQRRYADAIGILKKYPNQAAARDLLAVVTRERELDE